MNHSRALLATALIGLAGLASHADAQLIADTTYQGVLDSGGDAAAGVHQIRFRIFDAAAGGNLLATQTRQKNFVTEDEGRFTFDDLDFSGVLATDADRYIEIGVRQGTTGNYTILGPRQPVTAAPTSQYAWRSGNSLDDAFQNGARIFNSNVGPVAVDGVLNVGTDDTTGLLNLWDSDINTLAPIVELKNQGSDFGGAMWVRDENGAFIGVLEADVDDEGVFGLWEGGIGSLIWDGAAGAGLSGELSIVGSMSGMVFNTNLIGDDSLALPGGAVNSTEILNEAGAANAQAGVVSIPSDGTLATLTSRSITVPADGYVLVLAQADFQVSYSGSLVDYMFGVSDSATSLPSNQDVQVRLPAGLSGTGSFDIPASAHGLFEVAAGTHTFYFNAGGAFGAAYPGQNFWDINLTLVYIPTAYGVVESNFPNNDRSAGQFGAGLPGMNYAEIMAERDAEFARHRAELEAQNAEMQRQLAELKARVDAVVEEQVSGGK